MDDAYISKFKCIATKIDEGLLVEAQDTTSGTVFSKVLNDMTLQGCSRGLIFDCDTIHGIVKDFFESKKTDKASLKLSNAGLLTYTCQIMIGGVVKEAGFAVQLEKIELNPVSRLEKLVTSLSSRVLALEGASTKSVQNSLHSTQALDQLEKRIMERFNVIENKFASFDESLGRLEKKPEETKREEQRTWRFNPHGAFASSFIVSEDNHTAITRTVDTCTIFSDQPLHEDQISKFSFAILRSDYIIIGVVPERALQNVSCYEDKAAFCFDKWGNVIENNTNKHNSLLKFEDNDIVFFEFDMKTGKFLVGIRGRQLYYSQLPRDDLKSQKFYPFLYSKSKRVGSGAKLV